MLTTLINPLNVCNLYSALVPQTCLLTGWPEYIISLKTELIKTLNDTKLLELILSKYIFYLNISSILLTIRNISILYFQ